MITCTPDPGGGGGGGGDDGIDAPQRLDADFDFEADTTDINCNSSTLGPTEKAWCASTIPQGERLTITNNALDNIAERGDDCSDIAQKGEQLLDEYGLRYYPKGTIPVGGRGGPDFGVLLSDVWINDYVDYVAEVTDSDNTKVKINFEFA